MSARDLRGCTCSTTCAARVCRRACTRRATASAAPGIWNRYPGARVDIESQEYSFGFDEKLELEWEWTERYASQPELLKYANHVADRFDLQRDIQLNTKVTTATFDESANRWTVTTDRGDRVTAQFCVMATGCLSVPKDVDLPGADQFKGKTYRTSRWPHEGVDFTGQTVAIIGTGSSAIQSIPQIAKQATHLTVFQRTPNFSLPANNGPVDIDVVTDWKANRAAYRKLQRQQGFATVMIKDSIVPALSVSEDERRKQYEECWRIGGFSTARRVRRSDQQQGSQRHRGRIRAREDPQSGRRSEASRKN